ncbi:TPA: hypothetical protein ACQ45K_003542 [Klebsiella variicola]
MVHDYYEHPNLKERLVTAAKSSSLHADSMSQASGISALGRGMLQSSSSGGSGGDRMLESRVAKIEADVENIKANLTEARADISRLRDTTNDTSKDVAVVLQKVVDIDDKLSKKPSKNEVESLISAAVNKQIIWTVATGIALLGLAKYIFS